jgi:outer membrane receptor protein involved in Fe transport
VTGVRGAAAALAIAAAFVWPQSAQAKYFNVPPGSIGAVAAALAAQAGVTIIVADPTIAALRSPGVRGDLGLRAALARALRGTAAEALFYDPVTIRIVRRQPPRAKPAPTPPPASPDNAAPPPDIVVTATKQNYLADTYPGTVRIVDLAPGWGAGNAANGTAAITRLLPSLAATNLGPGRDKLFIRGIADSSFSGPTQATTGQYLGDVRINYNAPDPDLNLYDIKRVEVLTGPQGTLYGAGSLGGIVRLVPNMPDTHDLSVTASGNLALTRHGGLSRDGAGMLNLPIADGRVALRFVVFGGLRAGYIDAPARGLRDINATRHYGERFMARAEDLSGWTVDVGFVAQNITNEDGQYTLRSDPPLTRDNAIAQPFHNDYRLGYVTARRALGEADLVSTTSIARHLLATVFDATGHDGTTTPTRFEEDNDITLISHETRVSGGSSRAPWLAGIEALFSSSILSRTLGPVGAPEQITGVVNIQAEASAFGQYSHRLSRTLTGTIGERVTFANGTGILIDQGSGPSQRSTRNAVRLSGTLALDWHPVGPLSAFFHYQQGYRAGGLAVAPSGSGLVSQKFTADDLNMNELGIRFGDEAQGRLSIRAAIFAADWNHIQADLVDSAGLPYTTNIGRGHIYGLDGQIIWRPISTITLLAAAFVNNSSLSKPDPAFATATPQTLPNVARGGGRIAVAWHRTVAPGVTLSADAAMRYVGQSRLGVGQLLDIVQGDYTIADASARLDFGKVGLSLALDNLSDTRANTFAFGNPFTLSGRDQITPLRPRTIRLGFDARF